MMGPETPFGFESAPVREEMESLALSGAPSSDYRSAMSSSLPAAVSAASVDAGGGDPLLYPPHHLHFSPSSPASGDGGDASSSSASSFLEPPSYADVVFSPFESQNNGGSGAADQGSFIRRDCSPRSARTAASDYLKIAVSDPQKEQETANSLVPGGATYVTYLINTRVRSAAAGEGETGPIEFTVRRRFRDVVTLADRLAEAYRGFFIPPRPDKNVVESQVMQKHEFVEQRRSALEKYLWRLAEHPVIGKSDELRVFLQAKGKLPLPTTTDVASRMLDGAVRLPKQLFGEGPTSQLAPQDVVQPAKGGRDLLRIFKELKQAVTNDWGGVKPLLVEEDKEFMERKEKMQDLEQQLSTASQQSKVGVFESYHPVQAKKREKKRENLEIRRCSPDPNPSPAGFSMLHGENLRRSQGEGTTQGLLTEASRGDFFSPRGLFGEKTFLLPAQGEETSSRIGRRNKVASSR
ncbi:hypothetical protein GW17_00055532 [Ensete ventricosum]|nr:hypothetical protein GW17_00055532 [Ensete ventricosum]